MDLPFHSASELKQLFKLIGKSFDAVQLSQGRLQGRFRLANLGSIVLIELQTNQHLLLNGERGPDCMSFCLEATGLVEECRLFNIPLARYSLNGFRQGQIESHFQLSANTTIYLAILSTSRFNAFLSHHDSEDIIEQLETNNALQIDPILHAQFRKKFQHFLEHQPLTPQQRRHTTNHLYNSFLEAISSKTNAKFLSYAPSPRQRLVREFVSWGFRNTDQDYNLDQISDSLFASRRTLIQGTKESLGMGPMEMMKRVRLEQVNWILRSPDARADQKFRTISEIAQHYGFQSRGHFAKAYQQVFAESPSETWLKSSSR
ncbi:HTH-type transcriptional activator RhaS [Synechococcus sp. MIT S9509]|uniref:helix-turn-helix domain-containing protein n=1 Tax=unclassified Synechococcus TaxID=2626047 RepID=UPI0007BC5638|nr:MULTISPECIES: helix-turn-helix domain-containing protein [unclassified Synechococcus]KZR86557.1 HTH-type transcriptional activator RhaS [Synechococcus sp. MIT S9504]KZR92502.1 HTH-type transcriptional activator RhaS [Synechococcus sp. MIT S9509]